MGSLFKVPAEIREIIYAQCLVVGKVYPYLGSMDCETDGGDDDDSSAEELDSRAFPQVALLRLCRAVHEEAEPILYGQNQFVLPPLELTTRLFSRSLYNDERRMMVKSVVFTFEDPDLSRNNGELSEARYATGSPEEFEARLFFTILKNSRERLVKFAWLQKAFHLLDLELDELVIDLGDFGVSMKVEAICALSMGLGKAMPKRIELLYWRDGVGKQPGQEPITELLETWTMRGDSVGNPSVVGDRYLQYLGNVPKEPLFSMRAIRDKICDLYTTWIPL
ncbi:hypothetical protein ACLMJK_009479 [Lecanora helva]